VASILTDSFKSAQMGASGLQGPIDFDTDAMYALLLSATGDGVADATKQGWIYRSDVTNEISGTGYTTGGLQIGSPTLAMAAHVETWDAADRAWTTATITASGTVIFKRIGADLTTPADDPVVGYWTFGGSFASTAGTFSIVWNASGILTLSG
jgi:hypothetical protein